MKADYRKFAILKIPTCDRCTATADGEPQFIRDNLEYQARLDEGYLYTPGPDGDAQPDLNTGATHSCSGPRSLARGRLDSI